MDRNSQSGPEQRLPCEWMEIMLRFNKKMSKEWKTMAKGRVPGTPDAANKAKWEGTYIWPGQVITPKWGILSCNTLQSCFKVLVGLIHLATYLWMKTRGKLYRGTQSITKSFHNLGVYKSLIRNNVLGKPMEAENMHDHEIHCFLGGGELGERESVIFTKDEG